MTSTITPALSTIMVDLSQALNQTTCYHATIEHDSLLVNINVDELTRTIGTWGLTWSASSEDNHYERSLEFRTDGTIAYYNYYDNTISYGKTITREKASTMLDAPFDPDDDGWLVDYYPSDSTTAIQTASVLDLIIALASITKLNDKKSKLHCPCAIAIPTSLSWSL